MLDISSLNLRIIFQSPNRYSPAASLIRAMNISDFIISHVNSSVRRYYGKPKIQKRLSIRFGIHSVGKRVRGSISVWRYERSRLHLASGYL